MRNPVPSDFPARALWGRSRAPVVVLGPAWPSDPVYMDVVDPEEGVVVGTAYELYDPDGGRWLEPPAAPERWVWNPGERMHIGRLRNPARRTELEFALDLEEFTRWLWSRRVRQFAGDLAHFVKADWDAWGEGRMSFGTWKKRARASGLMVDADPEMAAEIEFSRLARGRVFALDAPGVAALAERLVGERLGPEEELTPIELYGPRLRSTVEAAKLLGVTQGRLLRWTKRGAPHDRGSRRKILVNVDEIRDWVSVRVLAGELPDPWEPRIPVEEARGRLWNVLEQLNLSTRKLGKLIDVPPGTLLPILHGGTERKIRGGKWVGSGRRTVGSRMVERAEALLGTMEPLTEREKMAQKAPRAEEIRRVLREKGGDPDEAAAVLGIGRPYLTRIARAEGIPYARKIAVSVAEIVTPEEVQAALLSEGSLRGAARKIGVYPGSLTRIIERHGLRMREANPWR